MTRTKRWALAVLVVAGLAGCGAIYDSDSFVRTATFWQDGQASEEAMAALGRGDYDKAEALGKDALRRDVRDPYAILVLAVVYQNTGRGELARQYYHVLVSMNPQQTAMIGVGPTAQRRTIAEVAATNLAQLEGRTPQPPAAIPDPVERLAAGAGDENNVIVRFQTLRRLLDAGLITRTEYDQRRGANLGALLRYSLNRPPGADLTRPAPPPEQVVERLRTLAANFSEGSITAAQQQAERSIILERLLPTLKAPRGNPPSPMVSDLEAASAVGLVQRMRDAGVITAAEQAREKQAILGQLVAYQAQQEAAARMAAGMPMPEVAPTGAGVRLATVGSQAQAEGLWAALQRRFPDQLGGLRPVYRHIALRHHRSAYAVEAGPFADRRAAAAACRLLKAQKQSCSPVTLR